MGKQEVSEWYVVLKGVIPTSSCFHHNHQLVKVGLAIMLKKLLLFVCKVQRLPTATYSIPSDWLWFVIGIFIHGPVEDLFRFVHLWMGP